MARINDETTVSLDFYGPDGFFRSVSNLTDDAALRQDVLSRGRRMGALIFDDTREQVFAEGLVHELADTLLKSAPDALRAGEIFHHLPFEDDSPVDLIPEGDTLTAVDLEKDVSVSMPLEPALAALEEEAAAYAAFQRAIEEE